MSVIRSVIPTKAGAVATSGVSTIAGDLIVLATWSRHTTSPIPTHALQSGWTELVSQAFQTGGSPNRTGRLTVDVQVVTTPGQQSYQARAVSAGVYWTAGLVLVAGSYDLAEIDVASNAVIKSPGIGAPPVANPPAVTAPANGSLALAVGAWHLASSSAAEVGAPSGFAHKTELTVPGFGELALATKVVLGGTCDPGQWLDGGFALNINGGCAATIVFGPSGDLLGGTIDDVIDLIAPLTPRQMKIVAISLHQLGGTIWPALAEWEAYEAANPRPRNGHMPIASRWPGVAWYDSVSWPSGNRPLPGDVDALKKVRNIRSWETMPASASPPQGYLSWAQVALLARNQGIGYFGEELARFRARVALAIANQPRDVPPWKWRELDSPSPW